MVGNERSNLLSVGCECVYCCTAVGLVLCWYELWSGLDYGREAAVDIHEQTKTTTGAYVEKVFNKIRVSFKKETIFVCPFC